MFDALAVSSYGNLCPRTSSGISQVRRVTWATAGSNKLLVLDLQPGSRVRQPGHRTAKPLSCQLSEGLQRQAHSLTCTSRSSLLALAPSDKAKILAREKWHFLHHLLRHQIEQDFGSLCRLKQLQCDGKASEREQLGPWRTSSLAKA